MNNLHHQFCTILSTHPPSINGVVQLMQLSVQAQILEIDYVEKVVK